MMEKEARDEMLQRLVSILGRGKVLSSKSDLVPYTKDTYRIRYDEDYRYFPDAVVFPETTADVKSIVEIAAELKVPIIPKGGGSNRTGMLVPLTGGIVIDTIRMNRIVEVNVPNLYVTVQPGIILKDLENELAKHGLALNQEQGSLKVATVGGSISTSGFSRKHQKYGAIADRVMSLEVILASGKIMRTGPKVLYTSTGYRLHQLFVGAEGTLGVITEATLRVEPVPEAKDAILAFYHDFWAANEAALRTMATCVTFTGGEAYEVEDAVPLGAPHGRNGLFYLGFEGTKGEVHAQVEFVKKIVHESGGVLAKHEDAEKFMERYTSQWCGARALTGFEDALTTYVPIERMREFFDKLWGEVMPKHGSSPLPGEKYSLDVGRYRMMAGRFYLPKGDGAWDKYQALLRDIAKLVTGLGGSISSCHGVGIEHKSNLDLEYSEVAIDVMRELKKAIDPDNIMNPGKMLPDKK